MLRTYRYLLRPTRIQAATLEAWLGICCDLYNAALQERRDAWKVARKNVRLNDQYRELTELRASDPEYAAVPAWVERSPILRVERAMEGFFRQIKCGEKPGYPRFRSRSRYDSFHFPFESVAGDRVRIPCLGMVRFKQHRVLAGAPREVHISRYDGRWYVGFVCKLPDVAKVSIRSAVGVDLGLVQFATLSDGTEVENPRFMRKSAAVYARRQRMLSRRTVGSSGYRRALSLVARSNRRTKNQRRDFACKLARQLCIQYDLIAHENLNVEGMGRGALAKPIRDASWGVFLRTLACKAEEAGKHVVAVNPRNTSRWCSGCGEIVKKGFGERTHRCPSCGLVLGRDHNAALNILALGRSAVEAGQPADETVARTRTPHEGILGFDRRQVAGGYSS